MNALIDFNTSLARIVEPTYPRIFSLAALNDDIEILLELLIVDFTMETMTFSMVV